MSDQTRRFSPFDDDDDADPEDRTKVTKPVEDDATAVTPRPDATSVMPSKEWDGAWEGRAQVRAPRPQREDWTVGGWDAPQEREPTGKWWMPIVFGVVALLLLGALGWGIYLITTSDDDETGTPTPPASAPAPSVVKPTTTKPTTTPPTKPPTTEPTTLEPTGPTEVLRA